MASLCPVPYRSVPVPRGASREQTVSMEVPVPSGRGRDRRSDPRAQGPDRPAGHGKADQQPAGRSSYVLLLWARSGKPDRPNSSLTADGGQPLFDSLGREWPNSAEFKS